MASIWEMMKTVTDFIFLASKITADGDCRHEIKRCLLLGWKTMTNLDSIHKRDITLLTKIYLVKPMLSQVIMYGCESWTIKKTALKNWCLWTVVLDKTLESLVLTARRSNQSILKEISLEYSSEGLRLKQKLQYFGHLMWRTDSLEKTLMLERLKARGEGNNSGWDGWMVSLTRTAWVWASSGSWWWTEKPGVLQSMRLQRVGHNWVTELNWTHI